MYQQLWGYKVEEKLYLGVREQKRLNTTGLEQSVCHQFHTHWLTSPSILSPWYRVLPVVGCTTIRYWLGRLLFWPLGFCPHLSSAQMPSLPGMRLHPPFIQSILWSAQGNLRTQYGRTSGLTWWEGVQVSGVNCKSVKKVKQSRYTPWRRLGGEEVYSSYSFTTSALDGGEWSASRPGRAFTPGTHCTRGWVDPRAGLDTEDRGKILCPCRGSNPARPARSQTLYCLSYPAHKMRK
jgi:hypothetical protein